MYVPGVLLYECIMYQSSDNYVTAAAGSPTAGTASASYPLDIKFSVTAANYCCCEECHFILGQNVIII